MPNLIVLNSGHVLARWAEARRIDGNQVYETVPKDTTPSDVANRFRMNNTPGSFFPLPRPDSRSGLKPTSCIMATGIGISMPKLTSMPRGRRQTSQQAVWLCFQSKPCSSATMLKAMSQLLATEAQKVWLQLQAEFSVGLLGSNPCWK